MGLSRNKSISQWQTKKQPNYNVTFIHNLNVPKTTVILRLLIKLGLRCISKRITSLIFLNIYTLPKRALTHIILCFKIIDKANSKFDLKINEALHNNWRKPKSNAQQNPLALTLSL